MVGSEPWAASIPAYCPTPHWTLPCHRPCGHDCGSPAYLGEEESIPKDHISADTAKLKFKNWAGRSRTIELLWGDQVDVQSTSDGKATVKARNVVGTVATKDLGGDPLLEVYFIDVGQGDGVLIVTPDRRHVLIDGGYIRDRQPTGKNAADFVDWKFVKDYRRQRIKLDAMIASHCDADHYGGLWDLLSTSQAAKKELDAKGVDVDVLYHAGVSWWKKPGGGRWLGPIKKIDGIDYLTQLMGNKAAVEKALGNQPGPKLQGEWAKFMRAAVDNGCDIRRLSHYDGWVPGFEPHPTKKKATLEILAPVEYDDGAGKAVVRAYTKSNSQNTNGHSLLLRLGYGRTRILLTGDLNKRSMTAILEDINGADLASDVAKGCHHGSDDVSYRFLQAIGASATIISSGDNEGHAHPRPTIVAASAQTGHVQIDRDEMRTPLVYSTEISRSVHISELQSIKDHNYSHGGSHITVELEPGKSVRLHYEVVTAGDFKPKKKRSRRFYNGTRIVDSVTYGLVNVRTDGQKILCATMNETKDKWEVETFQSRF